MIQKFTVAALAGLAMWGATGSPAFAQNQNAANALNLFQAIVGGGKPAQPSQPVPPAQPLSPAGLAGMLTGLAPGAAPVAKPGAADLIQLLSQSLDQIDEPREIEIGRQLAAMLLGSKPIYGDMATQRYINQLGRWISLQSSRPDLPWTFAVLDDPGFNAFAAPGGYVFVTKGLMDRVADESELAGILAHEITHVTARHHLKAMSTAARTGLLAQVVSSQLKNDLGGMVSSQLLTLGRNIYARGLDQDDEFDADRTGVALAARAGFDSYGLVAVLQQLRTAAPDDALFALSLSTHPPAQTRLMLLEESMGTRLDGFAGQKPVAIAQRVAAAGQKPATKVAAPARTPARKKK
ncbi:MAG: M48 family metalloprotease [Polaromonas sp.]|nr:M48 family metalloprotease [Polaromonas sp.]